MTQLVVEPMRGPAYTIPHADRLAAMYVHARRRVVDRYDRRAAETDDETTFADYEAIRAAGGWMSTWRRAASALPLGSQVIARLDPEWDLAVLDDPTWATAEQNLLGAVASLWAPGLGAAAVTKLLHLKRPRLVPVIDRRVLFALRMREPRTPADLMEVIGHFRGLLRENADAVVEIGAAVARTDMGVDVPPARLLDIVLWSIGGMDGPYDRLEDWVRLLLGLDSHGGADPRRLFSFL